MNVSKHFNQIISKWFFTIVLIVLSVIFVASYANAKIFNVSDADQLTQALTTAASNGEDDLIRIQQGTYVGNFIYASSDEAFSLTVEGGYTSNFVSRVVDAANTVLDGNKAGNVLVWSSPKGVKLEVDGVTLQNGEAVNDGGGLYVNTDNGRIVLTNNTIKDNFSSCNWGGGIYIHRSDSVILTNNTITGNFSDNDGGGVCILGPDSVTLTNNTITGNSSSNYGGGVCIQFYNYDEPIIDIYNNIIWNNTADKGNDLYIDNDPDNDFLSNGTINIYNNDFDQSQDGLYIAVPFTIDPGNLNNQDPLFIDAENEDYRLSQGSPCIDKGNNNAPELPDTYKAGQTRIFNGIVDMGVYEYSGDNSDGKIWYT